MLSHIGLGYSAIVIRRSVVGVKAQGLIVVGDGLCMLSHIGLGTSAIVICPRVVGVEAQGLVIVGNGFGILSQLVLGTSAIVICPRVVGVEAQGLVIVGNGFGILSQLVLGTSAIVIRPRIVGVEAQGLVVVGDGLRMLPHIGLSPSTIVIRRSVVGIQAQSLGVIDNSGSILPQLTLGVPLIEIGDSGIPISLRTRPDDGGRRRVARIDVARGNRSRTQEAAPEIRSGLRTLRDRQRQGALEDRTQGRFQIRGQGYVPPLQAFHGSGRRRAGDGVVERGAQTEQIRIGAETRPWAVLFRRGVLHGQDARMLHGPPRVEEARRAEVDQHGAPIRKPDDIGGLNVAMQEIMSMHFLQRRAQVQGQMLRFGRGERPRFLQSGFQGGTVQVLHHDVGSAVLAEHVIDIHDVR